MNTNTLLFTLLYILLYNPLVTLDIDYNTRVLFKPLQQCIINCTHVYYKIDTLHPLLFPSFPFVCMYTYHILICQYHCCLCYLCYLVLITIVVSYQSTIYSSGSQPMGHIVFLLGHETISKNIYIYIYIYYILYYSFMTKV